MSKFIQLPANLFNGLLQTGGSDNRPHHRKHHGQKRQNRQHFGQRGQPQSSEVQRLRQEMASLRQELKSAKKDMATGALPRGAANDAPYIEREVYYSIQNPGAVEAFQRDLTNTPAAQIACVGISKSGDAAHLVVYKAAAVLSATPASLPVYHNRDFRYFNYGQQIDKTQLVTGAWKMDDTSPFFPAAFKALSGKDSDVRLVAIPGIKTRSWIMVGNQPMPVILRNGQPTTAALCKRGNQVIVWAFVANSILSTTQSKAATPSTWDHIGTTTEPLRSRSSRRINQENAVVALGPTGKLYLVTIPAENSTRVQVKPLSERPLPKGAELVGTTSENKLLIVAKNDKHPATNLQVAPVELLFGAAKAGQLEQLGMPFAYARSN